MQRTAIHVFTWRAKTLLASSLVAASSTALAQASFPVFVGREVAGTLQPKKISIAPGAVQPLSTLPVIASTIVPEKSLMITALSVVEDPARTFDPFTKKGSPTGAWGFGKLVSELAKQDGGSAKPVEFLSRILDSWATDATVNGDTLGKRTRISAIKDTWLKFSGGSQLDVNQAPFRLLAIVNRVDLRDAAPGSAGEARFVFGAIDDKGGSLPFTLILEYGVSVTDFTGLQAWAQRWADLSTEPAATYNAKLQLLTNDYTTSLGPRGSRPVGARLNQLRTNEIFLGAPWQLREFNIASNGLPALVTTKKTPRDAFTTAQLQPVLKQFLQQNAPVITPQGTHDVPEEFANHKMLAGKTEAPTPSFLWTAGSGIPEGTRRAFSLNTCNGCHAGETGTVFTHVFPRLAGQESKLSGFLTGITVTPVTGEPDARYEDLERRRQDLTMLVSPGAVTVNAARSPLKATH